MKFYVGTCDDADRTVFHSKTTPTIAEYPQYDTIYGPFTTKAKAESFSANAKLYSEDAVALVVEKRGEKGVPILDPVGV